MLTNQERSRLIELLARRGQANRALHEFLKQPPAGLGAPDSLYWGLQEELRARSEAVEVYLSELRARHPRTVTVL